MSAQVITLSSIVYTVLVLVTCVTSDNLRPVIHHPRIAFSEIVISFRDRSPFEINCSIPTAPDQSSLLKWEKENTNSTHGNKWLNMAHVCNNYEAAYKNKTHQSTKCTVTHLMTEETSTLILSFDELGVIDIGKYSCERENEPLQASTVVLRRTDVCFSEINDKGEETLNLKNFKNGYCKNSFKWGNNSTSVYEGKNTTLLCHLKRDVPRYKLIWKIGDVYLDGAEILKKFPEFKYNESDELANLTIPEAKFAHAGWYNCVLWDSENRSIFDESRVVASFDFLLRVHDNYRFLPPLYVLLVQVFLFASGIFLYEVLQKRRETAAMLTDTVEISDSEESEVLEEHPPTYIGNDTELLRLR